MLAAVRQYFVFLGILILCGHETSAWASAGGITTTGSIPRGAAVTSFNLTITVTDVDATRQTTTGTETDITTDRLRIYLEAVSQSVPLAWEGETPGAGVEDYYVSKASDPQVVANAKSLYDITYNVTVSSRNGVLINSIYSDKKVKVTVRYFEDKTYTLPGVVYEKTPVEIAVSVQVAKSAPTDVKVAPSDRSLIATFAGSSTATMSNGQTGTISNVVMVVIADSSTITDLPAMEFIEDENAAGDIDAPAGACTYNPAFTDGTTCVSCTSANYYLKTSELSALTSEGVMTRIVTPTSGKAKQASLENGKNYAVFLYNEPGGLTQSACYRVEPYPACALSECLGEGPATEDTPRCFIATAAYGSPLHKNLKLFTLFRDKVLLKTAPGKSFVKWYYKNGPAAAKVVAAHPSLALGVRALLWMPALMISFGLALANADPLAVGTLLLGFGLMTAWFWRHRRRQTV